MKFKTKKQVPFLEQMQQTECGLCCVGMILRYYNSHETLNDLREYMETGRDGLKLNQLKYLLTEINMESKVYQTPVEGLNEIKLPAIIFWNNDHFVVLEKIEKNKIVVVDPAFGRKRITTKELEEHFSGYVITAEPKENFVPQKKKKNMWMSYMKDLKHQKWLYAKIFVLSLCSYMMSLCIPIMVQYMTDEIALKNNGNLLIGAAIGLGVFVLLFSGLMFIRGRSRIKLQINLDKTIMGSTFFHLLRVPYKFFNVRSYGDLLFRLNSLRVVRDILSEHLIKGVIDFGALIFILGYMSTKSLLLTGIAVMVLFIMGVFIYFSRSYIVEANQYEIVENSKLQSIQVEALYSILGVKIAGLEKRMYDQWNMKYEDVLDRYRQKENIVNIYSTFMRFIQTLSPLLMLVIGIQQYFQGNVSLGEVFAFYALSNTLFGLSVSIYQTWNQFLVASSYLERVRDITEAKIEENPSNPAEKKISGDIKLDNVSFAYTKNSNEVVKNVDMHIKQGQKVAIVGPSGSGKSTMSKIILGLYMPTDGTVKYDDIELDQFNKQELRRQMGVVPQDIHLFNKSIYENIRMNNENIDMDMVKKAAKIAQIADEIESMPMGYHTYAAEMGANLSGGQRQRIALARAIVNDPKLIILDEATSSLDSINEALVSKYFESIGCTRIVIAHRLSTVIDSDVIYVMDDGQIVEQGTHSELLGMKGKYYALYDSQARIDEKVLAISGDAMERPDLDKIAV